MDKRGVLRTIVGITILLVLLVVVIIFIIGPEAVLPKAAAGGEWVADKVLGGLRKEKVEKSPLVVPKEIDETYDNIISALRSQGDGPCITTHGSFTKDFKDFKITLSDTPNGISAAIINKEGQRIKPITIAGKKPCVVGWEAARNFYDNYLDSTPCTTNCKSDYSIVDIEFRDDENIYVNGVEKDMKARNTIFKTRSGNVCFFLTENDWFLGTGGCDREETAIDTDCIEKIKENIPQCGKTKDKQDEIEYEPVFIGGTFYDKKDEWKLEQNKYYYDGEDTRVAFMLTLWGRVYGSTAPLTKEKFNEIFSSESEEIPEKDGVYYEEVYYGPKEDWEFKKGGEFCGGMTQCWVYTGDDEEVPEEFRDKGINPDKKLSLFGPLRVE